MASVNKVIIVSNLGRDPKIRTMTSSDAIANIAVATSYKSKNRSTGEQKEQTEWHRIALFGRQAEIVGQYLKKGSSVYVEGRLQTPKYTDKDGVERYATAIIAEQMQMLGGPGASHLEAHNEGLREPAALAAATPAAAAVAAAPKRGGKPAAKGAKPAPAPKAVDEKIPF